ncbi:DUF7238 family protein [Vibrio metschnikovii]|uniref:Uncharacterized protein n=1 Tax=Vibrio metschnikovii TaxID=28172 RepID=A0A9X0R9I5_VIBME|nr:hypothetical protein [Vibrio metschnikovii]MBC5852144.1 hypothetical protein [Vibrio metschnikovii]
MRTQDVLKQFDKAVTEGCYGKPDASDHALNALFHSEVVSKSIQDYTANQEDHFISDNTGHDFHKSFREWGVIADTNLALAVWNLLQTSKLFWNTIDKMIKEDSASGIVFIHIGDDSELNKTDCLNDPNYT